MCQYAFFFYLKQWIVLKVICLFPAAPHCFTWKNKNSRNKILSYLFWSWFRKGCFKFESSSEEFRRAPFCWQLRMSILLKSRSDDDRKGLLSVCPPAPLFQIVLCASLPVFQSSSALLPNSTSVHPAPVASWLCLQIKQTKMFRWLPIGGEAMCHHFL